MMYTEDMREISGFGGAYEQTCRDMVIAGVEWLNAHPDEDPKFSHSPAIYGIVNEDNDAAKALSEVVLAVTDGGCSGAMHHASILHILQIKHLGWEKYCEIMRKE